MRISDVLCTSLVAMALGVTTARAEPPVIEVGRPFPAIAFPSIDGGKRMSIADFAGRKVILHIFASW
jgi:hypothetical protein